MFGLSVGILQIISMYVINQISSQNIIISIIGINLIIVYFTIQGHNEFLSISKDGKDSKQKDTVAKKQKVS